MKKQVITSVILAIFNFFLILHYKYSFHNYNLSNFNLFYFGNLINIAIVCGLIFLLIRIAWKSKKRKRTYRKINLILFANLVPILIVFFIKTLKLPLSNDYWFYYPFDRFFNLALLLINLGVQLGIIIFLFLSYPNKKINRRLKIRVIVIFTISSFLFPFISRIIIPFNQSLTKHNYGVVLGAAVWNKTEPSPLFKGRLDKASELLKNGKILKIFLTGGNAPGELTESEAGKNYLIKNGVDSSLIQIEKFTSTTSEQINYCKFRIPHPINSSLVIFSDSFHLPRISQMCKFYGINASLIESDYKLGFFKSVLYNIRESMALLIFWLFSF